MAKQQAQPQEPSTEVAKVLKGFHQDLESHSRFSVAVDRRYRAYRGILERRAQANTWNNKQHPPYILQIIETMIASALDPNPRWNVRARPKMAPPDQIKAELDGAKAMEILLNQQLDIDCFAMKQRPFVMQGFITGLTVAKCYWRHSEAPRTTLQQVQVEVPGSTYTVPDIQGVQGTEIIHHNPTMEVVDVRDFIWHEAAPSLDRAMRVTHRCWYTMDELRQLEAAGVYVNVDQLSDTQDFSQELGSRDRTDLHFYQNRAKNQVEVLEQWFYEKGELWVISIGNRKVCLTPGGKAKPNPFWHGKYPFVTASSMPDLFKINGISEVEVIQDLQEMLWTLMNQRLDSTQMLANAVALIRSDVDDPDAFEWYPGARWLVDDPAQVKLLEMPPLSAEISVQAEASLKTDLQNISGGMPMISGTDQQMDSNTATAASIFTSLAQRRLAAKKQNFSYAYSEIGNQWIALNQQFITKSEAIEIIGPDGAPTTKEINPLEIQGRYHIRNEMMDESMMRQERRAEAQAKLQVAVSAALPMAQSGTPLNLQAFMDDFLGAFGADDTTKYYSAKNPLPNMQQPQQGGGQGAPQQVGGATAPQAVNAASPSNAFSHSPVAAQQQMAATAGGPNNGGNH